MSRMCWKRDYKYLRLRLADGRVFVVSARWWSDFLSGNLGQNKDVRFGCDRYFVAEDKLAARQIIGADAAQKGAKP